jgi:hypothetical protein
MTILILSFACMPVGSARSVLLTMAGALYADKTSFVAATISACGTGNVTVMTSNRTLGWRSQMYLTVWATAPYVVESGHISH